MPQESHLFTSECVTMGHPDKIADQISDAILDAVLEKDPTGKVACETVVTTGLAMIAGEMRTDCYVDIQKIVRQTIKEIGYIDGKMGFDFETCAVVTSIHEQSADIAMGVEEGQGLYAEQGAGDQGLMFGYATNETPERMPMPLLYARKLVRQLERLRFDRVLSYLRPDGKSQVTIEYQNGKPLRIHTVVVSAQHEDVISHEQMKQDIIERCIKSVLPNDLLDARTVYHVNPTGRFVIGGPQGDCGLTGRKIIVDTYGGMGSHGGGAFSGKDPSKVDRSASYMARYIAKNIVAAGLADTAEVQLAYAIGIAEPVSIHADTFGTGRISDEKIETLIREHFPLKPRGIIEHLDLLKPVYKDTARFGHFGRENLRWEQTDKVEELQRAAQV